MRYPAAAWPWVSVQLNHKQQYGNHILMLQQQTWACLFIVDCSTRVYCDKSEKFNEFDKSWILGSIVKL